MSGCTPACPGGTLLLLHGGSFTFRFPNTHAAFAARLCRRVGAQALLPDDRLAPEHPHPAAADDCETAHRWLLATGCQPAGRSELLRDEAVRAADKAHAAGVEVELALWPDTAHGVQMAPFLPEAGLALDQIARVVRARAGW